MTDENYVTHYRGTLVHITKQEGETLNDVCGRVFIEHDEGYKVLGKKEVDYKKLLLTHTSGYFITNDELYKIKINEEIDPFNDIYRASPNQ